MKKYAAITVSAKARYEDGGREEALYRAAGVMEDLPAGYRVIYDEPEESGMAGTETVLVISPRRVELSHTGAVRSHLVFAEGETHTSAYETPYGTLPLSVYTAALRQRLLLRHQRKPFW